MAAYTFLLPKSRQFPFDEVCEKIVRALKVRDWTVAGIKVDFYDYGSGETKYWMVDNIEGENFRLHFGREQENLEGRYNDIAAVSDLTIPGKELNVYSDESGPTLYIYVGTDWEKDKKHFFHGIKVNSKLEGKPRSYLKYSGQDSRGYWRRPTLLKADNDLNREYDPGPEEPTSYDVDEIFEEYTNWLKENVLDYIRKQPIRVTPKIIKIKNRLKTWQLKLFKKNQFSLPKEYKALYSLASKDDVIRILRGQRHFKETNKSQRYGLGIGKRLVKLGYYDEKIPEIVYEGFIWCGIGEFHNLEELDLDILQSLGSGFLSESYLVKIKPKRIDKFYLVDLSVQEDFKEAYFRSNPDRDYFDREAQKEYYLTLVRTFVPIRDYKGDYKKPLVLINRELDLDEVEVIGQIQYTKAGYKLKTDINF